MCGYDPNPSYEAGIKAADKYLKEVVMPELHKKTEEFMKKYKEEE